MKLDCITQPVSVLYDASMGNYISQDPIGLAGGNPTLYGYVKDVNSRVDIFGLKCWSAAKKKFWKKEAKNNPGKYSQRNLNRMSKNKNGSAPKMTIAPWTRQQGYMKYLKKQQTIA